MVFGPHAVVHTRIPFELGLCSNAPPVDVSPQTVGPLEHCCASGDAPSRRYIAKAEMIPEDQLFRALAIVVSQPSLQVFDHTDVWVSTTLKYEPLRRQAHSRVPNLVPLIATDTKRERTRGVVLEASDDHRV